MITIVTLMAAPAMMAVAPLPAANIFASASVTRVAVYRAAKRPPNWRRINHKINKRAKNAVKNGANPARVRKKVKAHKKKLYRRWKASQ